ncbi:MAG: S1 RNA-binding domain-containing protein [Polyangiaceae bacterium]|jgi:small subunit ribosomal protein S1
MAEDRSDSFAALFEQTTVKKARPLRVGERVEGTVILVGRDAVFIELDGKREAFIEANELRAPDGTLSVKVGDTIAAQVVALDEGGQVRLGRSLAASGDVASLERAREAGVAVEGKVTGVNKGGLEVDIAGHRAFCPLSQMDRNARGERGEAADPKELIGRTLTFLVTEVRDGGRNIVVSRRAVLEREAGEVAKRTVESLVLGSVVRGTVTAVRDFGAFVDLGGIEGLIPASEVAHDRSRAIADAVHAGDVVDVLVKEIKEPPKPGAVPKITLSLKALSTEEASRAPSPGTAGAEAPRAAVVADAPPAIGSIVHGKVDHIETYGIFVQLDGTRGRGGRGLVPTAELGVARGTDLRKAFPEGSPVVATVLETGDRKLRLSIKAAKDAEERAQFEESRTKLNAPKTLGTLGDLLKKRGR